jgi:O-antigen/teichoic acid export membrane protein
MSQEAHQKAAFFRQSGWLMIANIVGGALMLGVHILSKKVSDLEYGTVGALLGASILIPSIPLQMIFTRETADGLARERVASLRAAARWSVGLLFVLWLPFLLIVVTQQQSILAHWKITQPITLWLFVGIILASLVTPVFGGLLQGKQDFFWLGWVQMLNALLRVGVAAAVIFLVPGGNTAAGFMAGILAGMLVTLAIMIWRTRDLWAGVGAAFEKSSFLREVTPLMIGFGACQLLFCFDTVVVGRFFTDPQTAWYASAGTLSRALMWLVLPLVAVMFPKLVHNTAKAQKSNVFGLTLLLTAGLAIVAGIGLSLIGSIAVRIVYGEARVAGAMSIIPWFAGAMVPLTLANVLVNALLAKADFRVVPWLAVLAGGYAVTLWNWHPSLPAVLQTLAGFTTLLFLVGAVFTWGPLARRESAVASAQP